MTRKLKALKRPEADEDQKMETTVYNVSGSVMVRIPDRMVKKLGLTKPEKSMIVTIVEKGGRLLEVDLTGV